MKAEWFREEYGQGQPGCVLATEEVQSESQGCQVWEANRGGFGGGQNREESRMMLCRVTQRM